MKIDRERMTVIVNPNDARARDVYFQDPRWMTPLLTAKGVKFWWRGTREEFDKLYPLTPKNTPSV